MNETIEINVDKTKHRIRALLMSQCRPERLADCLDLVNVVLRETLDETLVLSDADLYFIRDGAEKSVPIEGNQLERLRGMSVPEEGWNIVQEGTYQSGDRAWDWVKKAWMEYPQFEGDAIEGFYCVIRREQSPSTEGVEPNVVPNV